MASTGPQVTGTVYFDGSPTWLNVTTTRVNTSDNSRATAATDADICILGDQDFSSITAGASIDGIEVVVEGNDGTGAATVNYIVGLSKDGGASFPFTKTGSFSSTTDANNTHGGPTDLWTTTWTVADFNFGSFALSLQRNGGLGILGIDFLTVNVYYTAAAGVTGVATGIMRTNTKFWGT